ncbi:type II toxin-antitoxin system VapC family toxin [[Limnothrix rosea] IAM M-220]|uniref:type II toxin-antitoxin system VapC family toxin n=1 Tax=[Limnothrix rosea] IAM M-220 TaxID=454133 RepID=UPI0009603303|nr:type II toxin-antitoxin system VapC family toxin [[Limnothrix rosea] IAM M-220]OKH15118.1 twitching motility protein PilT [[Limnothrix rosea] IAM M-220]
MYLLDTNIYVAFTKGNASVMKLVNRHFLECYLSTVVLAEIYAGVYCSQQRQRNLEILETFLQLVPVIDFDEAAALEFGKIQGQLRRIGKPSQPNDVLIAAVAKARGDVLVTANTRHFENIEGLLLGDWTNG